MINKKLVGVLFFVMISFAVFAVLVSNVSQAAVTSDNIGIGFLVDKKIAVDEPTTNDKVTIKATIYNPDDTSMTNAMVTFKIDNTYLSFVN